MRFSAKRSVYSDCVFGHAKRCQPLRNCGHSFPSGLALPRIIPQPHNETTRAGPRAHRAQFQARAARIASIRRRSRGLTPNVPSLDPVSDGKTE
jgi:hypothetical protein